MTTRSEGPDADAIANAVDVDDEDDDFERGESNVRADESSDALSKRTRATVGPVVLGGGAVVARMFLW